MPEVEIHLAEMHEAAAKMRRSGFRIGQSVQQVHQEMLALIAQGIDSPALRLLLHKNNLLELAETIQAFAAKLDEAADDTELVYAQANVQREHFDPNAMYYTPVYAAASTFTIRKPAIEPEAEIETAPIEEHYRYDSFISQTNRTVYHDLLDAQTQLADRQDALAELLESRARTAEDLDALKDRLASFNPGMNVENAPRVLAMQGELLQLDHEIIATRDEITHLQGEIDTLTSRLDRVKPGSGANLTLITQMETSQTVHWVDKSTYDCVNHVVNKLPIPEHLALDAHLWDDTAAKLTEYGITQGDTPLAGAVIVLEREHSYADDVFGHLFYVERVAPDGTVWITDNDHPNPVRLTDLTNELHGTNIKYLYFPWHTRA